MRRTDKKSLKAISLCVVLLFAVCGITGTAFAEMPLNSVTFSVTAEDSVLLPGEGTNLSVWITPSPGFDTLGLVLYISADGTQCTINPKNGEVSIGEGESKKVVAILGESEGTDASAGLMSVTGYGRFGVFSTDDDGPNTASDAGILFFTERITLANDIDISSIVIGVDFGTSSENEWRSVTYGTMAGENDREKMDYVKATISVVHNSTSVPVSSDSEGPVPVSSDSEVPVPVSSDSEVPVPSSSDSEVPVPSSSDSPVSSPANPVPLVGIFAALGTAFIIHRVMRK